jgi:hypothetical protein
MRVVKYTLLTLAIGAALVVAWLILQDAAISGAGCAGC